jgi:hypothetical protein
VIGYGAVDTKYGYTNYGYYNAVAMTQEYNSAARVSVSNGDMEVNFNLIKAKVIRGTVTLPEGQKAGKKSISIYVKADGQRYSYSVPDYSYITEGENSCEFLIPLGELETSFRICISTYNYENDQYCDYYYDGNGGVVSGYDQTAWITVTDYDTVINIQLK